MIVKELDGLSSEDKFTKAGRVAEEQMVYYLRRAFKEDKNVCVFNDLRLEQEQDAAQIDHLILHRYGITIVEGCVAKTLKGQENSISGVQIMQLLQRFG